MERRGMSAYTVPFPGIFLSVSHFELEKFIAIWYNKDNLYLDRRYAIVATN